jgi:hypothetical protein
MKLLLIIIISSCLFLNGCIQTEGILDIQGKVLDELTKKSIPNRKVLIQGLVYTDSKLVPTDVGQFYTDSSGHFRYTLNKTKGAYSYNFIFVGDSAYSYSTQEMFVAEIERNSKFLSFRLSKLADFIIKIERISKSPLYDTLYVSWKTDGFDGKTLYPHKLTNFGIAPDFAFRWIGGNVKSVIETKAFANKTVVICWELFRNGRKKEVTDTVYCERDVNNSVSFRY